MGNDGDIIVLRVFVKFKRYKQQIDGGNVEALEFRSSETVGEAIEKIKKKHLTYKKAMQTSPESVDIAKRMKLFKPSKVDQDDIAYTTGTIARTMTRTRDFDPNATMNRSLDTSRYDDQKNDLVGVWLDNDKPLGHYGDIKSNDRICLFDTQRVLVYSIEGDEVPKQINVDESLKVQDLVYHVCQHANIDVKPLNINYQEISREQRLALEEKIESREYLLSRKLNLNFSGVLQKRENIDVKFWFLESTAGSHEKKYRKGMKTDQDIIWLKADESLRQQGVGETETLILRRRYFGFQDQNESAVRQNKDRDINCDAALQLTYASCQRNITSGAQIVKKTEAVTLAAIQLIAEAKDLKVEIRKEGIDVHDLLPPELTSKKKLKKEITVEANKMKKQSTNNNQNWAKRNYVAVCKNMPSYGFTFFMVRARPNIKVHRLDAMLFGISRNGVILVNAETRQSIGRTLPLLNISAWSLSDSCFLIEFDDAPETNDGTEALRLEDLRHPCIDTNGRLSLRTVDGEQIQQLLAGYIELLRQMMAENTPGEGDPVNPVIVAPPKPSTAKVVKHIRRQQQKKLTGQAVDFSSNEEQAVSRIRDHCKRRLGVEQILALPQGAISDEDQAKLNDYETALDDFNNHIKFLAGHWDAQNDPRGAALLKEAQNVMAQMEQLILGAKAYTGDEFDGILELLEQKDVDGDILTFMMTMNINDKNKRKKLLAAAQDLLNAMGRLLDAQNGSMRDYAIACDNFLRQAEAEQFDASGRKVWDFDTSSGLPYRVRVMQEARAEILNPTPANQVPYNDSGEELGHALTETLSELAELSATGGVVDNQFLDTIAESTSTLVKKLVGYGQKNLDANGNAHLLNALQDLMQEMSRLLESTDNKADNLRLPEVASAIVEIRRVLPAETESEKSKALKAFLQQSVYDVQMCVPQMVQTSIGSAQRNNVSQDTMQQVMTPAVEMVQKTKKLGQVSNTLCTIPELTVNQCGAVVATAEKIQSNTDLFANKMHALLNDDGKFSREGIRDAAMSVSNALNELLLGLKFFDNEAYQNMLKALSKVHNPQEMRDDPGSFEEYQSIIVTKVSAVLQALPRLNNEDANTVQSIAKSTLEAAEYLSHLLVSEPHHQGVSIDFVKEVASIVLKSLQDGQLEEADVTALVAAVNALFNSLQLNKHGDLVQQMLNALEQLVLSCQMLENQGLRQTDAEVKTHAVDTHVAARQLKFRTQLLAPLAEHTNITNELTPNINAIRHSNEKTFEAAVEDVQVQAQSRDVEEKLVIFEGTLKAIPNTAEGDLRDIENQIGAMEQEILGMREEIDEQSDGEVDEGQKVVVEFNKGLIDDALGILGSSKELVAVSNAMQREHNRRTQCSQAEVYTENSDFSDGLVSAALEVVKAIGALKQAVADSIDGTVSKEYLIVCAQLVKEKCVALQIAGQVQNTGSKLLERLNGAANNIKKLTDKMALDAQQATHFDTSATDLVFWKNRRKTEQLYLRYDTTDPPQYFFKDVLKLREVVNEMLQKEQALGQKIRDLRRKKLGTKLGMTRDIKIVRAKTADELMQLASADSVANALSSGLNPATRIELELKEQQMQARILREKAEAKLKLVESINPENLED